MSLPKELLQLREERTKLEDESSSLKEEQKKLEERVKSLEQKIMEELGTQNEETRQVISHLKSRINDLEQRLGQVTQTTGTNEPKDETASQTSYLEATENVVAEINPEVLEGPSQESVAPMSPNDSTTVSKEDASESHQGGETKKKRKFW